MVNLAERMVFGEEAADGLAVDLAGREVDETLGVLGAVLDLHGTKGIMRFCLSVCGRNCE